VQIHYEGNKWEGNGPWKSRLFSAPKMARCNFWVPKMARCHFTGPKKSLFLGPNPLPLVLPLHAKIVITFFFPALFKRKLNLNLLLASLKTHTYFKNCSKSHIKFLFQLSFTLIGRFFPVYIHGTGTIFRITGGFRNNFYSQRQLSKLPEEGFHH
jgi:hypothetical protein